MRSSIGVGSIFVALLLILSPALQASPQDVRGSGNVAVASYRNDSGLFVLWSNGRITDSSGKEVNSSSAYNAGPVTVAQPVNGNVYGSAYVAVAANCNSEGTYILFSDGSLKKPRHSGAAAPLSAPGRIVMGVNVTAGQSKSGDQGWTCRKQISSNPYYMEIVFNKKFSKTPCVQYQCVAHAEVNRKPTQVGWCMEKHSRCEATPTGFKIYFQAHEINATAPNSDQYSSVPYSITFVVLEEP